MTALPPRARGRNGGQKKARPRLRGRASWVGRLAIPYFRMANRHTIIGAKRFHFRVRDGVGWFTLAMVTKQFGVPGARRAVRAPSRGRARKPVKSMCRPGRRQPPRALAWPPGRLGVIGSSLTGN